MIITTHTASSFTDVIEGPEASYKVETLGRDGVAQLEVSSDDGETWQGAAKPVTASMAKFDHSSTGNEESLWRIRVELTGGTAITHLSGAETIQNVSVPS